jgi:hypothetical protein
LYFAELCENLAAVEPFRYLHPGLLDFTYVPRNAIARNKSRIDFFIISENLIDSLQDCTVADNLQSSMFDHKAIYLQFYGQNGGHKKQGLCNKIINDPLVPLIVDLACKDCYFIYQDRDLASRTNIGNLLSEAHRIFLRIRFITG